MGEIDTLLDVDHKNVGLAKKVLNDFSPDLLDLLNDAATIFKTLSKCFGEGALDTEDWKIVLPALKVREADLETYIRTKLFGEPDAQPVASAIQSEEARAALSRIYSRHARGTLKLLASRSFLWAATDFLRFRQESAFGHLRVEVEAVALMKIMANDPEAAWEWYAIRDEASGGKFFRKHQRNVKKALERFDLKWTYDSASGMAQHARFSGVARGLTTIHIKESGRQVLEERLSFQPFDPQNSSSFILMVASLAGPSSSFPSYPRGASGDHRSADDRRPTARVQRQGRQDREALLEALPREGRATQQGIV
jgi:hypothetical protein